MRIGAVVTILTLACGALWGVQAQDGGMMGGMGGGRGMAMQGGMDGGGRGMLGIGRMGKFRGPNFYLRMKAELGLDNTQVDKIKAIRMEMVTQMAQTGAKLAVSRAELRDLLDSDPVPLDKVNAKISEVSDLRATLIKAGIKAHVDATAVLTDDQRKKVESMERPGPDGRQGPGSGMQRQGRRGGMFGPGLRGRGTPFPGMMPNPDPTGPGMGDEN